MNLELLSVGKIVILKYGSRENIIMTVLFFLCALEIRLLHTQLLTICISFSSLSVYISFTAILQFN
jgi:hypothetical protein